MRRFLESRVDVTVGHVELGKEVVRRLAMHQGRAGGERRAAVRGRGQRLVVDVDERRCVFGNVAIIGHHDRHSLADMHHLVARERRTIQILLIARARQADDHELGGEVRHDVGAREDGVHARQRERGRLVDAADRSVRMRAAHEGGVQHPGHPDVVDEAALALEQRLVFQPRHRAADDSHARSRFAASSAASTIP